jgi:hypothetical protein
VLLVESGSRSILEQMIPVFRQLYPDVAEIDVMTCFAGAPRGVDGRIYRVADYPTPEARKKLYADLNGRGYGVIGIICAAEPIMTKWKFALAARVSAKILIVNENADFFWCDLSHWRTIAHFALFRAGVTGASAIPALARLLFFPITAAYLLIYAGAVHFRRALRYHRRIRTL